MTRTASKWRATMRAKHKLKRDYRRALCKVANARVAMRGAK